MPQTVENAAKPVWWLSLITGVYLLCTKFYYIVLLIKLIA
jgi:hypothetical protein